MEDRTASKSLEAPDTSSMEERTEAEVNPPRPLFNQPVELHVTLPPYSAGSFYVYVFLVYVHDMMYRTPRCFVDTYLLYIMICCLTVYSRLISFWPPCFGGLCYYACLNVASYRERTGTWNSLFWGQRALRNSIIKMTANITLEMPNGNILSTCGRNSFVF